ncbi:DUF3575 domain-containing protein [Chryseobacterium sp.]|uniref:DUF3575 domain-containing protein n=1 Tax=Chryseobacterium sp. TaxID=1871047 RepID=UPI0011CABAF3|nr:DUF3575 domain-containing protein [Chryseobacterium sp.]TXF79326.1 DUF3575 domain-containing protein [Chryseobacterium sp.]
MKKLILFAVLLFSQHGFAQDSATVEVKQVSNIIKTNVAGYFMRNYNLTYERIISKRISIAGGFGIIGNGKIPFESSFNNNDALISADAEIKGSNFTIEPRIYLGKGFGQGFYLAPYFRYSTFEVNNIVYDFRGTYSGFAYDFPLNFSGKVSGASGGLMIGAQWFLGNSKKWVLDAWFVGAHYGKGSGTVSGRTNETLTPEMQAELKKNLDDLDIPLVKYTTTVNEHGADAVLDGPWAGIRSGISIGYRF